MHLELDRKGNVAGNDRQSDERTFHHNDNINNNHNIGIRNSVYRDDVGGGRERLEIRNYEGAEENTSNSSSSSEGAEERETIDSTTRMEIGEIDDIDSKIIATLDSTAMIIDKSSPSENFQVTKPMIEKYDISTKKKEGRKLYQYISTLIAGNMAMQSGMTLGWTSPILPFLSSKDSFLPDGLTESKESWICSLMALGAVLGAIPAGKVADRIGRKAAIIATSLPFTISWLMMIFRQDLTSLYVARFIGGIGSGSACVLVPVYIGEVAEASIRGALGSFFPLLFSLGIVFVYVAGAYLPYTIFNVACCLALLPFFASVYFLPETPMFLVHTKRWLEAVKSLRILRGDDYDRISELKLLRIEADRLKNRRGGLRDLVGTRAGRKALVTCVGLMWFQQMSGIDAVLFYTVTIFQDAGGTIEPYIATIIIGIVEVIMSIVVATVIDKFGRKPLLVLSGTAMTLCLGVLGYYFKLKADGRDVISLGWLPLTCLSLYNVVFSLGYGSVPFAIISELFPPETKGVASSISIMTNWTLVFTVTKVFPTMVEVMGQATTFWTFACMTAMSAVFAYVFVPETKGKTLQDIQTKLEFRKDGAKKIISAMEPA